MLADSLYSYSGGSGPVISRNFPDPFYTHATRLLPRTIEAGLRWCESFWLRNGTYSRALKRVVSYFLTDIEISSVEDSEKEKYETFLNDNLKIRIVMETIGEDFMCYGNAFRSLFIPFKRFLDNGKGNLVPIDKVDYKFQNGKFIWKDPFTGKEVTSDAPVDRKIMDESRVYIIRWSPHDIKIKHHPISGNKEYYWNPPPYIVKQIKDGDPLYLRDFPWEMVQSVIKGRLFKFAPGVVFHLAENTLSGINTNGWGMSQLLLNFHNAYYVQMAKMYNEVLMNEYLVPFRVISPPKTSGALTDPLLNVNVSDFNSKVLSMLKQHTRNPGGYYSLPFPLEYQALGAEGVQLSTYEHIEAATDEMLNAAGVPAEFYRGTLQFQAMPTALRLFQQTWPNLQGQLDLFLDWLMKSVSRVFNWQQAKVALTPVTLADDIEKRHILMQLMAGRQVSAQSVLAPLGLDNKQEQERIIDEDKLRAELEEEFMQEMQQKQMLEEAFAAGHQGMMPGGAMAQPGAMPGNVDVTPQDMDMQAEQEAQRLLAIQDYSQRRSEMNKLKKSNETLHALVKQKMQNIRQEASTVGQQQVLQQMVGGPMGQGPPMM